MVKVKSAKCECNKNIIENDYCRVKPTRDGYGNVTIYGTSKVPLNDLWMNLVVYYKYQVFQRFMIDFDFDVCKFMKEKGKVF